MQARSHLLQMRGLKLRLPLIGCRLLVASFTDAWIETEQKSKLISEIKSHLLQMRGLKPGDKKNNRLYVMSHLLQMRGLKLKLVLCKLVNVKSHLLQMRGLKRF